MHLPIANQWDALRADSSVGGCGERMAQTFRGISFHSMGQPQVFRQSRRRVLTGISACLVFVATGIAMVVGHDLVGIAIIVFFGLALSVNVATLIWPVQLTVSDHNFKFDGPARHRSYEFDHCGEFQIRKSVGVWTPKLIVFRYDGPGRPPRFRQRVRGARLASVLSTFRIPASDLVDLLNASRAANQPVKD